MTTHAAGDVVTGVTGLRHGFKTKAGALAAPHGIDCQFRAGTWTVVMGPSGFGEPTFLN